MHPFLLHFISLLLLQWIRHLEASSIICLPDKNYTSGSPYQRNLDLTFASLSANASLYNYITTSTGRIPDVVYGLVHCTTGYTSLDACKSCAVNIATEIVRKCPGRKRGSIFTDMCSLQYADWDFFSTMDSSPRVYKWGPIPAVDPALLRSNLERLLLSLSASAAEAGGPGRMAYGQSGYTDAREISAMVQCSGGISAGDCSTCLRNVVDSYFAATNRWEEREGGMLVAPSCNMRFDTYKFYANTLQPAQPRSGQPSVHRSASHGRNSKIIVMLVVVSAFALVVISGIYSTLILRNHMKDRIVGDVNRSLESLLIEFDKLREATNDFADANKLGQGGFGPVYKGRMPDGQEVAVKRLSSSSKQGLEELQTEVMLVAKLMHQNLVRLSGFCIEEEEKLLVYEYLSNGSLDKCLFDEKRRLKLDWEMRYNIVVGIARGLLYLHEECPLKIIHRDMKASNILLDGSMMPKISDFGLARLFPGTQNHCFTNRIIGTYGYMAPEYAVRGRYSTKSDIYSFGILVLEIITGRKNSSFHDSRNLQSYAWKHWTNGSALKMLDPSLGEQFKKDEVMKCINIALLCVQEAAEKRPTMSEIILKLGSYTKPNPSLLITALPDSLKEDSAAGQNNTDQPFSTV